MFDRSRSYASSTKQEPVLAGATISAEGQALIYVADGLGGVAVKPSTGAASEKFAGFSRTDNIRVSTETVMEEITIPVAGGVVNLAHANLVASSARAYDVTTAAVMADVVSPPAAGEVTINYTNGTIEFNVADAGDVVTVTYTRNLTIEESKLKYRESLPNNIASSYFGLVDCMGGKGVMFTDQFDTSKAYADLGTIYLGANGLLTSTAGGTAIGFCTLIPSVGNAILGVKFTDS